MWVHTHTRWEFISCPELTLSCEIKQFADTVVKSSVVWGLTRSIWKQRQLLLYLFSFFEWQYECVQIVTACERNCKCQCKGNGCFRFMFLMCSDVFMLPLSWTGLIKYILLWNLLKKCLHFCPGAVQQKRVHGLSDKGKGGGKKSLGVTLLHLRHNEPLQFTATI